MTPLFWKDIARPYCRTCQGTGESQGLGVKYVCELCAYNNIMDLRLRLEAVREALKQSAEDLCPYCGVHDLRERRNNNWCHPEHDTVCVASDTWDRRDRLLSTVEAASVLTQATADLRTEMNHQAVVSDKRAAERDRAEARADGLYQKSLSLGKWVSRLTHAITLALEETGGSARITTRARRRLSDALNEDPDA